MKPGIVFLFSGIVILFLASSLMADDGSPEVTGTYSPDTTSGSPGAFIGVRPSFTLEETPVVKHSPLKSMVFSAAVPGLGQATNGRWAKATAFIAVGAVLLSKIAVESDRSDRYLYLSRNATSDESARAYYDQYSSHFDRRDQFVWWAVVFWAYNIFDAYIDGNLFGFLQQ